MKITFMRDKLLNLEFALKKEYLLANGRGGYSSSTILDCHSRKYHGLLNVAAAGRTFNLLSKLEAIAVIDEREFELATNKYPGVFHPAGHQFMESFTLDLFPSTLFRIGDVELVRSVVMPKGEDTVLVRWEYRSGKKPVMLKLMPLLAYREIHGLTRENLYIRPRAFPETNGFKVSPYKEMPALYVQTSLASHFFPSPLWLKNLEYLKERNRGYDYQEDLFSPGVFEIPLKKGDCLVVRASTGKPKGAIRSEWTKEEARLKAAAKRFAKDKEPLSSLKRAADVFLYETDRGNKGVIAGFHWFGDWGRDTLISLTGLTLCRGEKAAAAEILARYGGFVRDGQLPNMVAEKGEHAYNSADSAMLYFRAVQDYLAFTGDLAGVKKKLLKPMLAIVRDLLDGKSHLVKIGEDGLVWAGNENTNLTWMDAAVWGKPVTPRHGAPVEINALWYNALCFLEKDLGKAVDPALLARISDFRSRFEKNFQNSFWNPEAGCLLDVFRPPWSETAIRPNQLFAVGLPYTCLDRDKMSAVVEIVKQHLVTPFGLRTLSPQNPLYRADYSGDQAGRDFAYHQGLVWPWLIGIFTDALLKLSPKKEVRKYVLETFNELLETHLQRYGLNHISEIFTPNPPHVAKGCMAQAWSEAEVIRALEAVK